jgi:AraC-like DNA-binding protein
MLMDGEYNLAAIANCCGFEDQSYFTKVFKKDVGISPKKYKSNYSIYI